jgi:adenosylcobinamide-GDP ribazoletransferase
MDLRQYPGGIKAGLGFLTTLPARFEEADFEAFMGHIYLFIIVGAMIGVTLGAAGFIFRWLLPAALVPVLVIACIYLLTGINHLDGLSDFGDGVIAHGTREKKVGAMKDVHAGAGGILFIGMDLLFLYAALSLFSGFGALYLLVGLFAAEVCAKVSMITVAAFGKSLGPGMGSMLIEKTKKEHYLLGLATAIVVCVAASGLLAVLPWLRPNFLLYALAGFLAVSVSVALGLFVADIASRHFGGVNGDVMGAANEIGRAAALVVLGVLVWTLW